LTETFGGGVNYKTEKSILSGKKKTDWQQEKSGMPPVNCAAAFSVIRKRTGKKKNYIVGGEAGVLIGETLEVDWGN